VHITATSTINRSSNSVHLESFCIYLFSWKRSSFCSEAICLEYWRGY